MIQFRCFYPQKPYFLISTRDYRSSRLCHRFWLRPPFWLPAPAHRPGTTGDNFWPFSAILDFLPWPRPTAFSNTEPPYRICAATARISNKHPGKPGKRIAPPRQSSPTAAWTFSPGMIWRVPFCRGTAAGFLSQTNTQLPVSSYPYVWVTTSVVPSALLFLWLLFLPLPYPSNLRISICSSASCACSLSIVNCMTVKCSVRPKYYRWQNHTVSPYGIINKRKEIETLAHELTLVRRATTKHPIPSLSFL